MHSGEMEMSIIVNSETRVVVQGITGGHGAFRDFAEWLIELRSA